MTQTAARTLAAYARSSCGASIRRPEGKESGGRKRCVVRLSELVRMWSLGVAVALTVGLAANADSGKARIVSHHAGHRDYHPAVHVAGYPHHEQVHYLHNAGRRANAVVTRRVVDPGVTVSRSLSEQPVHPHLVEVQVGVTTIYLDPHKEYYRQNEYPIDENHTIMRALRLHDAFHANRARIIRHHPRHHRHAKMADARIQPGQAHSPVDSTKHDKNAPNTPGDDLGVLAKAE